MTPNRSRLISLVYFIELRYAILWCSSHGNISMLGLRWNRLEHYVLDHRFVSFLNTAHAGWIIK